jgi:hypothetical protein
MARHATPEGRDSSSHVQRLVEHFATRCRNATSTRQVRDLAEDFVLDIMGALRSASLGDVANVLATLERRKRSRPARPIESGAARARRSSPDRGVREVATRAPVRSRDPFDITMPGELLEPAHADVRGEEELPPASAPRSRQPRLERSRPKKPSVLDDDTARGPESTTEATAASDAAPAVALREGEQLVRANSAGVVIRRARSA